MILNIVIGLIAGLATPALERWMRSVADSIWLGDMGISDHEFDLAALLVILMVASIVAAVLGVDSSVFLMCFGALVGLFGRRIWRRIAMRDDAEE
ncbi:hypothetical protein JQC91_00090 [Jannaschia sp. Os4]|uniref:hypothetical protein n=1 Tax=Jannaschia sp. Os4 TaxID=2807617 RepID=UPI00193A822B|nr:hypothetical protein [Jannaschia sp. Os4]MBM2574688.1 hypothetical protein [Jannaschia sp. Os4]